MNAGSDSIQRPNRRQVVRKRWLSFLIEVAAASLLVLLASCYSSDESRISESAFKNLPPTVQLAWNELPGRIVDGRPLRLLPGRAWEKGPDDTWLLVGSASLLCQVTHPPKAALEIEFQVLDPEAPVPCLEARWDGQELTTGVQWQEGRWRLEIASEQLTEGPHFLVLRRCTQPVVDGAASVGPSAGSSLAETAIADAPIALETISYGLGEQKGQLQAVAALGYQYLVDLLTLGVTSAGGNEKLDGLVVVGERRVEVRLPSSHGGLFSATLHNASRNDKTLTVALGTARQSFTIGPLQRQRVHIPVLAGIETVNLTTTGGQVNDFFQVAAPHFVATPNATQKTSTSTSPARPSIVLLSLDTTRRDALGVYGGATGITPQLDALASRATVFTNARSTAPWTLPSHASMFTGLYPTQHGAGVSSDHLEGEVDTLAEHLRRRGYLTAGFAGGPLTGHRFGLGQGFSFYRNPRGAEIPAGEMTDLVETFLKSYVEPVQQQLKVPPPLFLFVNYFDPHFPYRAPQPHRQKAGFDQALEHVDAPWRDLLDGSGHGLMQAVEGELPFSEASRQALKAAYRAETSFMDHEVGRLLEALRRHRLLDDAWIIVTADHGELLGEGGYFTHNGRLDAELLEIPLIIKSPGQQQSQQVDSLVSLVDIFPTALRIAGIEPGPQNGLSLLAEHREALVDRPWTLSEEHDTVFHRLPSNMRLDDHVHGLEGASFRRLTWSGTARCFSGAPGQWQPQVPCVELDAAALSLQQRVAAQAQESQGNRVALSAEEQQQLRALGYIQ